MNRSKPLFSFPDYFHRVRRIADVCYDREDFGPCFPFNFLCGLANRLFASRTDDDLCAFACKRHGTRFPETLAGSANDRNLALYSEVHTYFPSRDSTFLIAATFP